MTEFIGSRISLISKRDIRYVGTLHEISSENSTVALENVTSYGTEGRRPEEEIPPNLESVYEYIVFRGSDVKDLRIEEGPKEVKKPDPPKMPDDPAILGSTRKPQSSTAPNAQPTANLPPQPHGPLEPNVLSQQNLQNHNAQSRQQPPHFPQQPFPYGMPPPHQRFVPGGFPTGPHGHPGHSFPGMPYAGPPGWFPPYGFSHQMPPNQFPTPPMPIGPPGQQQRQPQPVQPPNENVPPQDDPTEPPANEGSVPKTAELQPIATVKLPFPGDAPAQGSFPAGPSTSNEMKQGPNAAVEPAPSADTQIATSGLKSGRIVPAIPLSPLIKTSGAVNGSAKSTRADSSTLVNATKPVTSKTIDEANRDARAAVAAAMAKLPATEKKNTENTTTIDTVTKSLSELKSNEQPRSTRGNRGHRGGNRGGRDQTRRIEIPKTDFDFETANAKFNKHDLVKEAIATGSPVGTPVDMNGEAAEDGMNGIKRGSEAGISIPVGVSYNKSSSFFDDISSEIKDRAESKAPGQRPGREFRNEERQKNLETFGQGSVDNYRYGRGRGRGRGRGYGRGRVSNYRDGGNSNVRSRQAPAPVEG